MRAVQFAETQEASLASAAALAKVRFPQVINEGELARVEAEHFDAATQVDVAKATLAANRASLGFLLGIRGDSVPEIDPAELDFRVPPELANATQEGLFKSALDHRPDLVVAAAAGRRAQASGALARRAVFPDVAVGVQYQQQGTDGAQSIQPPTVAVALTAVLPVFSQRQGEIERAAADGEAATWGLARAEAAVLADVNSGLGGFVAARSRVVRMRDQLLPARKKALDVVRAQYDRGAAPLMDWLDAQRTYATANRELNEAMVEFWAQVFALEAATGTEFSK
jgi:cobalt-zinc-cadmium efflux system outer membrane protein